MDFGIKGKFALVTGGSHGIGLAIAKALAAEGCHVAICSRTYERLQKASNELQSYGTRTLAIRADALDDSSANRVMSIVDFEFGGVDILVNNVGGGGRWGKEVEDTELKTWREVYEKNAMAAVQYTQRVLPKMRLRKWGRIVTNTSFMGGKDGVGKPWFIMAKAAETALMKSLATSDLTKDNITFNCVAPGNVFVPGTATEEEQGSDKFAKMLADCPQGRLGTPEEVASVVAFLCSQQASLVNGANILVDGGQSRGI